MARSSTSAGSGPVSPKSCGGRSSNGSALCGKRSVRSPKCRRSMPTSGSGRSPRSSSKHTAEISRKTATCARRRSPACGKTSGRRIASSRSGEFRLLYGRRTRWRARRRTPMAKLQLTDVEIYVKDLKATRAFYTKKIGLKVRSSMPKWGYLALGATKGGEDAALTPWQPVPEWGREMYESRLKMIGGVTGIGFITSDLKRTIADLKKKGVKTAVDGDEGTFGRFTDPDGNVVFLAQPAKPKVHRAGLSVLGFVTVAARDAKKTGEFLPRLSACAGSGPEAKRKASIPTSSRRRPRPLRPLLRGKRSTTTLRTTMRTWPTSARRRESASRRATSIGCRNS